MLILTRRPAETIYIGEQVTVTVLGVVGNQVRFGIEAPRSITIDRAEIHERKKRAALNNANGNVASGPVPNGNVVEGHVPDEVDEINGNIADGEPTEAATGAPNGIAPTLKLRR
jgi:carbon storage regulator